MKFGLDDYAHLDSPLHRWEPRCKLIGLMGLIFAFAFVENWQLIPAMLGVTAGIFALSKLPVAYWMGRLRYPGFFLIGVVVLLPFVSGETIWFKLGVLSVYTEGSLAVVLISARFLAIMTLALVLFGTAEFLTMLKAMRSLGLSPILADMMLLFYRYLFEVGDRLKTMQTAMRLRGFRPTTLNRRTLSIFASLAGTLLVQSYEQSERIYQAMRLRGYGEPVATNTHSPVRKTDAIALFFIITLAASFIAAELLFFA